MVCRTSLHFHDTTFSTRNLLDGAHDVDNLPQLQSSEFEVVGEGKAITSGGLHMQRFHILRWSGSLLTPRIRRPCYLHNQLARNLRLQSIAAAPSLQQEQAIDQEQVIDDLSEIPDEAPSTSKPRHISLQKMPSPPPSRASSSAKLSALHARLSLSPRLPLETLARCLVDPSADIDPQFNNASLSVLGGDLFGYYTSEYILCRFPRLPTEVVFAAMWAYCGPQTLAAITREWGVEVAAEPGGEVDPGYLQCKRQEAGNASVDGTGVQIKDLERLPLSLEKGDPTERPNAAKGWKRGMSSRTVYDDYFGDEIKRSETDYAERPELREQDALAKAERGVTLERASMNFVRALMGAVYLHCGKKTAKLFFREHILSRFLSFSQLFEFRIPTLDLSKLCAREGFESPVARILSETGRKSRHPVFVVGVFAGKEKLGEGAGSSLDEARVRAAVAALKGWYLYSPLELRVPSDAEGGRPWQPVMIDGGEVVV